LGFGFLFGFDPGWHRALGQGHNGIGMGAQTSFFTVRNLAVAIPATPLIQIQADPADRRSVQEVIVAADAVLLNHRNGGGTDADDLRLSTKSEYSGVTHPVVGLEKVFPEYIVVGYVTVGTRGCLAMRTVHPGSVLTGHYVTIHTGLRIVGQI
jgi:hypothetical protein